MDQNQYYQQPLSSNGSSAQGLQDNAKLPIMTGEPEYHHQVAERAQTDTSYGRPPGRTPHPPPTSQISADRGAEVPLVPTGLTEPQPRYRPEPQHNGDSRVDAAYQQMIATRQESLMIPMNNGRVESPPSAHDHAARPATVAQVPTPYQGQSPYRQRQPQFSVPTNQTQQYQWEERPQHPQSQRQARTSLWQQDQQVQALEEPRLQQQERIRQQTTDLTETIGTAPIVTAKMQQEQCAVTQSMIQQSASMPSDSTAQARPPTNSPSPNTPQQVQPREIQPQEIQPREIQAQHVQQEQLRHQQMQQAWQQRSGAMQEMPQKSSIMPPYMLSQPTQSTHPSNPISPHQYQDFSHGTVSVSQAQQPVQQQAQQKVQLSAQQLAQQFAAAQKAQLLNENPESRERAEQNREALASFDRFLRECQPFVEIFAKFEGTDDWAELMAANAVAAVNQRTMAAEQMQQAQKSPHIKRLAQQLSMYLEIKERMPSTTPRDCLVTIALRALEQLGIPFMPHQQDQRALETSCARPDAVTGKRVIDVTDVQEDAGTTSAALPIPVQARTMEQRQGVDPVTSPSIFKQPSMINQAALQNLPAVFLTEPAAEYVWLEEELAQLDATLAAFAEDERKMEAEAAERQAKAAQASQQPQPSSSQPTFHNSSATSPTPEHLRAQRFHQPSCISPAYIFPSEAEIQARLAASLARQDEAESWSPLPTVEGTLTEAQMLRDLAQAGSSALGKRKRRVGEAEDQPCADGTPEAGDGEVEFDGDSFLDVGNRPGIEDEFARMARGREEMEIWAWIDDLSEDMDVETGRTSRMVW